MIFVKVEWPEIQDYMERKDYNENVFFDPRKNCWFIPASWEEDEFLAEKYEEEDELWRDIRDLEDAME